VIKNILYSFGINFVNFAFPILLLPFYITVFGINNYGVIVLATSLINIVSVIPDYSWIVLGVKNLLSFKNNSNNINNYISKVINIKFILFLLSVFFLVFLLAFYSDINSNLVLCLSLIFQLFSRSQNAHWIFLGINKVKIYFYINSICKIMSIFFVFLYIKNAKDIDVLFFILGFFDFLMIFLAFVYSFCG
jgi:O-antigen/teichoic acid export membrane protein